MTVNIEAYRIGLAEGCQFDRDDVAMLLAELDRVRGAVHADLIADTHYCDRHEMMFQNGYGAPERCPHCESEALEAEVARLREVVALAEEWWLGHRPLDFTEAEHLAAPTVNVTRGALLAKAVARWRTTSPQPPGVAPEEST